jgi:hypothetical protein
MIERKAISFIIFLSIDSIDRNPVSPPSAQNSFLTPYAPLLPSPNKQRGAWIARPGATFVQTVELDGLTVDFDLLRHKFSESFIAVCCDVICAQPSCVTTLATLESRINELSRRRQRGIEYSDEEGSQQAAGTEPRAIQISPSPPEPRCGPFQIGFLFQVGDFAASSMARGRYRRQREYPQPPPPIKNNTTITINRVSILSPLFGLSIP